MTFNETKKKVANHGVPPDGFLTELVTWARNAPLVVYVPNDEPDDIFALIKVKLGPWQNLGHRLAALCEVMRVHAGFESSWNWNEGVDHGNKRSLTHKTGEETGIFQVSFDSEWIEHDKMKAFAVANRLDTPETFIPAMKSNHPLALEYYARLVRINVAWAGPLRDKLILPHLSRLAVKEFQGLIVPELTEKAV